MRADRPSSTARLIARCTLLAAREPRLSRLVPVGCVEPLKTILSSIGGGRWFDFALRHSSLRALLFAGERAVLPGIIAHYLVRKRWLEARATAALADGCDQLVVLGAGFDTLAFRLHRSYPTVRFFELDHPATQHPKAAALSTVPHPTFLPADLAHVLPTSVLQSDPNFDPRCRTCFIAEGLLMYFSDSRVREILSDLARHPDSTLAFSFMAPDAEGRAAFRGGSSAIGAWLRLRREPLAWALPPAQLAAFLRPFGFHLHASAGAAELRTEILAPSGLSSLPLAEGEHLALAATSP